MRFRSLWLCLAAVLLAGCQMFSGTRMEEVSAQKAMPATLDKVLLVGITTTPQVQADMEQAFAHEFRKRRREVLLASRMFPGDKQPLREEVMQRVKAEGVTGVLVVRLLSYEIGAESGPESGFSLHAPARDPGTRVGWEPEPGSVGAPPGAAAAPRAKALVESRLYDVASGQVVWQGRSRSVVKSDARRELEGFVATVMRELRRSGWL